VLLQFLRLQLLLIGEQPIVILPVLALIARAVRGLAGLERLRVIREFAGTEQTLAGARPGGAATLTAATATIFRERGLSSDTSILADYSVHVALETIAREKTFAPGSVHRVAIVGPGLDFTNKADGYDYYPQQTTQPFALIDTLRRLGLAAADLQVTTFDINVRVNDHLQKAA
jgi:hypothetical protein